jgi:hypothetical protein
VIAVFVCNRLHYLMDLLNFGVGDLGNVGLPIARIVCSTDGTPTGL